MSVRSVPEVGTLNYMVLAFKIKNGDGEKVGEEYKFCARLAPSTLSILRQPEAN